MAEQPVPANSYKLVTAIESRDKFAHGSSVGFIFSTAQIYFCQLYHIHRLLRLLFILKG